LTGLKAEEKISQSIIILALKSFGSQSGKQPKPNKQNKKKRQQKKKKKSVMEAGKGGSNSL
jgi:hypothetical protein